MSRRKSRTLLLMSVVAAVSFGSVQPAHADWKSTLNDIVGNTLNGGASPNYPYNQNSYQNPYGNPYAPYGSNAFDPYGSGYYPPNQGSGLGAAAAQGLSSLFGGGNVNAGALGGLLGGSNINPYAANDVNAALGAGGGLQGAVPLLLGNDGNLSQLLGAAAAAAGMKSSGLTGSGLFGGGFGQPQGPVAHNGVLLNPRFYNGPYAGTDHQMQSALNLDFVMTLLEQQLQTGIAGGYINRGQGNGWMSELNAIADDKIDACGRKGLSYNDSYSLVTRLNDLISRIRLAWHSPNYSVSGAILTPLRNDTLEKLYLLTTPPRFSP